MSLPRNVKTIEGRVYFAWKKQGRVTFQRLPALDHPDFQTAYDAARSVMEQKLRPKMVLSPSSQQVKRWNARPTAVTDPSKQVPSWLLTLAREARKRSLRRSIDYTLTVPDLGLLAQRADGRCELTNLPFEFERHEGSLYRPFAPSLDRIDPACGYSFRNIRLVCVIVNAALNQWGEQAFWKMVQFAAGAIPAAPLGLFSSETEKEAE